MLSPMFSAYLLQGFLPVSFFIVLLLFGVLRETLTWKGVTGFVTVAVMALWAVIGMKIPTYFFASFVTVLDIVLLLKVFKGDVSTR